VPWLVIAALVVGMAGCAAVRERFGGSSASTQVGSLSVSDRAAIYGVVVRRLCTSNDGEGSDLPKPFLYIVRVTDDSVGQGPGSPAQSTTLPPDVQAGVTRALSDLGSQVRWVDTFASVALDSSTGAVVGGGAIVQLGSIRPVSPLSVRVPAGIYYGNLGAGGRTYIVDKVGGVWKLTGASGSGWQS
jgi:hypothetical protein